MFEFASSLFWYKLIFTAEIVAAEAVLVKNLRRRKKFALRVLLCAAALALIAFMMPIVAYEAWWTILMFFMLFFCSLCALKFCFKETWWNVVFCGLAAYTVQHIAYVAFGWVNDFAAIVLGLTDSFNPYQQLAPLPEAGKTVISVSIYLFVYAVIFIIAHFAYADKINPDEVVRLGRTKFVALAAIILITDNIFNSISIYTQDVKMASFWLERGYNIMTCILALQLQFSQLVEKEMQTKLRTVQHILLEEQKQYEAIKQNIDTLNIKCHDMKHQLHAIRKNGVAFDEKEMREMEEAMSVYEAVAKTGNETLDLILTEKGLRYGKDNVKITCIADGAKLDFIYPSDLYSLFGNAIENSVEAVLKLEESKRNVSVVIKGTESMVSVHIENYFDGELTLRGGLPITSKGDSDYHGFGMLSMKTIVEKYGGNIAVEVTGKIFNLNILFPI